MDKILVLYVFHIYNKRVEHFIKNSIFDDENIDFIIISNNINKNEEIEKNIEKFKNTKIIYRENIGFDFGGWSYAILKDNLYYKYNKFLFVNSSVIGPFIPSNYNKRWVYKFVDELKDNIKLFGCTINTNGKPKTDSHVQSYLFTMDKITLEYLIKCKIFSNTYIAKSLKQAIYKKEILMSRKIIQNNWNIGSLLSCYKNVDFTFKTSNNNIKFYDDLMYNENRNIYWNEYELFFIKGNRNIILDYN